MQVSKADHAATVLDRLREHRRRPTEAGGLLAERAAGTDVASLARRFRSLIARRERQAVREILDAWIGVRRRLVADIDLLAKAITAITSRGDTPSRAQLLRLSQLEALLDSVSTEVARFGRAADRVVYDARRDAVQMAQDHVGRLVGGQLGPAGPRVGVGFRPVDTSALEAIVGTLGQGPVHDLLTTLGDGLADRLAITLTDGVARGRSPRETARDLRQVATTPRHRALTIARTETLRAYRESTRTAHSANADLLEGWQWLATLDTTTCPMCVAMHGELMPTGELQGTHPNCRCTALPVTRSWADLGFPDIPETRVTVPSGTDWFRSLSTTDQQLVLGPAKHAAWLAGDLQLADLVGYRDDPVWGPVRWELPSSLVNT